MPRFAIPLLAALVVSSSGSAIARPVVAVFDLESDGVVSRRDTPKLTDLIATELASSGRYKIVPRSDLKAALTRSKKASFAACYDEACQIEIGRELAAEKTLSTKISKLGKTCLVTMQLYDLRESAAARAASQKGACDVENLVTLLERATAEISGTAVVGASSGGAAPPPTGAFSHLASEIAAAKETPQIVAAREKKAREAAASTDWRPVATYARTVEIERDKRVALLREFLERHPTDNPHRGDAMGMIKALETGWDPGLPKLALEWRNSKHAGVKLSKTEVTRGDYQVCIKAGRCPEWLTGNAYDRGAPPNFPLVYATQAMATAFCTFAGGRLPTKQEWVAEATAGGTRKYPWGKEEPSCKRAVMYESDEHGCLTGYEMAVCSRRSGNSASGLCDLLGNGTEWVSDAGAGANGWIMDGDYAYDLEMLAPVWPQGRAGEEGSWAGIRCARSLE